MKNVSEHFNIKETTDYRGTDAFIRSNVVMKRENAWALICAIFIASIGLNVNSTAVIIGAMLISPLMGPIVGGGYALAIDDFELFKLSVRNFIFAIVISLMTSTIYF